MRQFRQKMRVAQGLTSIGEEWHRHWLPPSLSQDVRLVDDHRTTIATMMNYGLALLLFLSTASSFTIVPTRNRAGTRVVPATRFENCRSTTRLDAGGVTESTSSPAVESLKSILEGLQSSGDGTRLIEGSSEKWKAAIYDAVGAPATADAATVARALTEAMKKPDNQFAILLGGAEDFDAEFPSDPVEYDDGSSWTEVRLRSKDGDELLVTMGVSMIQEDGGSWKISSLDWQDFRDKFYPGLSGREWLRAF